MTTIKDFQIISKLGEGAYSSVYKVKRLSDNQEYALKKVKLMNLSEKEKQNALNEVRILASIQHTNIIAYKEAFLEEVSNSLCIVMEYANNGDLYQKICEHQKKGTNFQEPEIWSLFIQMTKALKALHDLKIFHRDLKSANVFLNKDGTVKLGDLNVSKVAKKGLLYTQTGTPYYASPEVWRDMPYDLKSDVWSLGCVLYEIATLKPPFRAEDMEGLYKKVLKGYYPRIPTHYSQDLSNVIRALLQVSPTLRPSCDKILLLPAITKRMEEKHLTEPEEDPHNALLNTIRIPKNLHFLTERLPKANYNQLRTRKMDKNKFLQTLAGYKDLAAHQILEENIRGSESVDSHKKMIKEDGRVYLPPVGKEAHNKDIMKIYGGVKEKEKKEQIAKLRVVNNASRNSVAENEKNLEAADGEPVNPKKNREPRRKVKNYDDENVLREGGEREKITKHSNSGAPPQRAIYKVHNLNQEYGNDIKELYGGKSHPKILSENVASKDPVHLMIKRHKNQIREPSPTSDFDDREIHQKKQSKLPSLAHDKYSKLPPLAGEKNTENLIGLKKHKVKELSRAYKVNMENLDDISDRYSGVSKISRKDKNLNHIIKNAGPHGLSPLEYGINGVKYGKGYD